MIFEVLLAEMKRIKRPGASIGIWHQGKEQIAEVGITSIENRLPVTLLEIPTNGFIALTDQYENIEVIMTANLREGDLQMAYKHKGRFSKPESLPLSISPATSVHLYETDTIITLDEPFKDRRGEFLHAPDGTLTHFHYGFRIHKKIQ